VDEESFILGHAGSAQGAEPTPGPRIAVLHAWLWLENPAGLFATDNWALPWHRLDIAPPTGSGEATPTGLVAALATGGRDYFLTLLRLRFRRTVHLLRRRQNVRRVVQQLVRGLRHETARPWPKIAFILHLRDRRLDVLLADSRFDRGIQDIRYRQPIQCERRAGRDRAPTLLRALRRDRLQFRRATPYLLCFLFSQATIDRHPSVLHLKQHAAERRNGGVSRASRP
jgi:hypothetical protein